MHRHDKQIQITFFCKRTPTFCYSRIHDICCGNTQDVIQDRDACVLWMHVFEKHCIRMCHWLQWTLKKHVLILKINKYPQKSLKLNENQWKSWKSIQQRTSLLLKPKRGYLPNKTTLTCTMQTVYTKQTYFACFYLILVDYQIQHLLQPDTFMLLSILPHIRAWTS